MNLEMLEMTTATFCCIEFRILERKPVCAFVKPFHLRHNIDEQNLKILILYYYYFKTRDSVYL